MELFVEPAVRRLVADSLGVRGEELLPGISLRDDLAADSLDLAELTVALELEFAIVVPEAIVDEVQTYDELVVATGILIRARCKSEAGAAELPPRIWARLVPAEGTSGGTLERADWLTPYAVETIAADAWRAGEGARLEVNVAGHGTTELARARDQFAALERRGVQITVRNDDGPAVMPLAVPMAGIGG